MWLYVFRASKPTPIITQEYTSTLEDMILQRVKDGNYNDVIPRDAREKFATKGELSFLSSSSYLSSA